MSTKKNVRLYIWTIRICGSLKTRRCDYMFLTQEYVVMHSDHDFSWKVYVICFPPCFKQSPCFKGSKSCGLRQRLSQKLVPGRVATCTEELRACWGVSQRQNYVKFYVRILERTHGGKENQWSQPRCDECCWKIYLQNWFIYMHLYGLESKPCSPFVHIKMAGIWWENPTITLILIGFDTHLGKCRIFHTASPSAGSNKLSRQATAASHHGAPAVIISGRRKGLRPRFHLHKNKRGMAP